MRARLALERSAKIVDLKMTRQEQWEASYLKYRYLFPKSVEHISRRFKYLIENVSTLEPNGKIGLNTEPRIGRFLMERLTHTLLEYRLRGIGPDPMIVGPVQVPRAMPCDEHPRYRAFRLRNRPNSGGELFKYGVRARLERFVSFGEIRIQPASRYSDPSLNYAMRDDELSIELFISDIAASKNDLIGISASAFEQTPNSLKLKHGSDYLVSCYSTRYQLRMYDDFAADSCAIIYDLKEFERRLNSLVKRQLPDWICGFVPVHYIDPDCPPNDTNLPIPAVKSLRYAYQYEVRYVAHPPSPEPHINRVLNLSLGSLQDIAEVV